MFLKNCYTTILPTNPGAKILVLVTLFRICNNICTLFWMFSSHQAICLQKAITIQVFFLSLFWNLNFELSKGNYRQKLPFAETWIPQPPNMRYSLNSWKPTLGKGLECVEVEKQNQSFSVFKPKLRVMIDVIFYMILKTLLSI